MQFSSVMPHFATQSSFFFSHSETLSPISNHLFRQRSLSLSFEVLQHQEASLLLFILTGQGDLTKVVDTWSFPNAYNIQPELSFFTFWNVVVQYLGRERPWSNSCPILLGCHLIYRNIKSIIMLHLLWNIHHILIWWSLHHHSTRNQVHILKPYTFQSEFRKVVHCLVWCIFWYQ